MTRLMRRKRWQNQRTVHYIMHCISITVHGADLPEWPGRMSGRSETLASSATTEGKSGATQSLWAERKQREIEAGVLTQNGRDPQKAGPSFSRATGAGARVHGTHNRLQGLAEPANQAWFPQRGQANCHPSQPEAMIALQ
jgi:hypothetical protein